MCQFQLFQISVEVFPGGKFYTFAEAVKPGRPLACNDGTPRCVDFMSFVRDCL